MFESIFSIENIFEIFRFVSTISFYIQNLAYFTIIHDTEFRQLFLRHDRSIWKVPFFNFWSERSTDSIRWRNQFDHSYQILHQQIYQHRFAQYDVSDMQNRELWIKIRTNFEHFTNQHWRQIDKNVWTEMLRFCYTYEFWIDWDMTISTTMTKTVQNDYYYAWIKNQLKTIQQNYNIINKTMIRRMNDLNIQQNFND